MALPEKEEWLNICGMPEWWQSYTWPLPSPPAQYLKEREMKSGMSLLKGCWLCFKEGIIQWVDSGDSALSPASVIWGDQQLTCHGKEESSEPWVLLISRASCQRPSQEFRTRGGHPIPPGYPCGESHKCGQGTHFPPRPGEADRGQVCLLPSGGNLAWDGK